MYNYGLVLVRERLVRRHSGYQPRFVCCPPPASILSLRFVHTHGNHLTAHAHLSKASIRTIVHLPFAMHSWINAVMTKRRTRLPLTAHCCTCAHHCQQILEKPTPCCCPPPSPVHDGKPNILVSAIALVSILPEPSAPSRFGLGWRAPQARPDNHQRCHSVRALRGIIRTSPSGRCAAAEASVRGV